MTSENRMTHRFTHLCVATTVLLLQQGCLFTPTESVPSGARAVGLADFNSNSATPAGNVLQVPEEVTAQPEVVTSTEATEIGDTEVSVTRREIIVDQPGIGAEGADLGPIEFDESVKVGVRWPVDGLVGQINGRPVFAAEFFTPIQDRLIRIAADAGPAESQGAIIRLVHDRWMTFVNSELVIAEAESGLNIQMQEGLFAWLTDLEEEVTAQRGGTRFGAAQSLMDDTGMTMEEFIDQQRKLGLAGQLIRKKVDPRAIVSWRDIEQVYQADIDLYVPPSQVVVGRILLLNRRDSERIEQVKAAFAEGRSFQEVAAEIGVKDGGEWRTFTLTDDNLQGLADLKVEVRNALVGLQIDQATIPIEGRTSTTWYSVLGFIDPPSRSIFDAGVQLTIKNQLQAIRYDDEERKYLESLRRRWVNDEIKKMELRLIDIALRRYWQP